jgi:5-methyltetrahydrofolate--homocysteine methyltransferase
MPQMKIIIDSLEEAGLRSKVKVFVGGAPVTQEFAKEIGADFYSIDAAHVIEQMNGLYS